MILNETSKEKYFMHSICDHIWKQPDAIWKDKLPQILAVHIQPDCNLHTYMALWAET